MFVIAGSARAEFIESTIVCGEAPGVLYGSLLIPSHKPKPPVVLIISGSGPTDRDGNSLGLPGKNNSLKMLAQELAIAGFASVRYDKRGVGESGSSATSESDLRFQTYVEDVQAWVKKLSGDERFSSVIIIGHSEGATLGLLAAQNSKVSAYVSLAGPAQSASKLLRAQLKDKLPSELIAINEDILNKLEKKETVKEIPPALMTLYRPSVQSYLMSWFAVVPAEVIGKLKVPVAIFQGDTDIQVSVNEAVRLATAQNKAELYIIKGMNHILKDVPNESARQIASYSDPFLPLNAEFVTSLVNFLKRSSKQQ
jgi:hypothetical protein